MRKASRSYRIVTTREELPAAFRICKRATVERVQPLLDRYAETGSIADRDALVTVFLPMLTSMATRRKFRGAPDSELGDLISDGCVAVMNVIRRKADLPFDRFLRFIYAAVKLEFNCGFAERTWAGSVRPYARQNRTMLNIRSAFLKQHGRMPTGAEIRASLNQMIQNGQIEKEFIRPRMISASAVDPDGVALLSQLGSDRRPSPLYETIGNEAMKLALKGLKGVDRKLFQLAIEGMSSGQIAGRVGLAESVVYRRVNGLLWAARCRADLAAYVGAEPESSPARLSSGALIGIGIFQPARLVG